MQQIQYDVRPGEFADAMRSTRSARMIFWLVVGAALVFQLVAFVLVDFGGVLDSEEAASIVPSAREPAATKTPAPSAKPAPAKGNAPAAKDKAPAPATAPAARTPPLSKPQKWQLVLHWSLPGAKFVAMVSAMLLVITLVFAVGLSLIGKLGGMAGLISAFFWSLILCAMVMPWQQVLIKSDLACGALYNLGELVTARARLAAAAWQRPLLYYARFVAYPAAALLVWLVVHIKFVRACMRMHYPHALPAAGLAPAAPARAPEADKPKPKLETRLTDAAPQGDSKTSARGSLTERLLGRKTDRTEKK
jgi:hypothetical protein